VSTEGFDPAGDFAVYSALEQVAVGHRIPQSSRSFSVSFSTSHQRPVDTIEVSGRCWDRPKV